MKNFAVLSTKFGKNLFYVYYGTIIVDGKTHSPVTILDGQDGKSLRVWLKDNKDVKAVARDRVSAYAKVIAKELARCHVGG